MTKHGKVVWQYGVTTVPERLETLLPDTLKSLEVAGFPEPRLFVDGPYSSTAKALGLPTTYRDPKVRAFGNWVLALWELYLRNPHADRYAIFQDDLVAYPHLREYLERSVYPHQHNNMQPGYWNLYTFPINLTLCPKDYIGWYPSDQCGKGAVGLVFCKDAVTTLLSQSHTVGRPQNIKRGHRAIDGGIVTAMRNARWREYVHNPSLVQHTGTESTLDNRQHDLADSFRGVDFDARKLIEEANDPRQVNPKRGKVKTNPRWDRFFFKEALDLLKNVDNPTILEIGAIRDARPIAARADGHATVKWAESGYRTITLDTSAKALDITRRLINDAPNVELIHGDGLAYLETFQGQINLLYLDGPHPAKEDGVRFSLLAYTKALPKMPKGSLILIDDCDITPGKGDQMVPKAVRDGWKILKKDRQVLLQRTTAPQEEPLLEPQEPEKDADTPTIPYTTSGQEIVDFLRDEAKVTSRPKSKPKANKEITLIGYSCANGLGELNRQIAKYVGIDYWRVIRHKVLGKQPIPKSIKPATEVDLPNGILLFTETPFLKPQQLKAIKDRGGRIVSVPMLEWTPKPATEPWTDYVDLWICPTRQCYVTLSEEGYPCVMFPWPIDLERYTFIPRDTLESYLFINGFSGGFRGRKGAATVRQAFSEVGSSPLVVSSQERDLNQREQWKKYGTLLDPIQSNRYLYTVGSVLLAPHHCDGLGLEPMEAMACGMPVITPDAPPWNEFPALARLPVQQERKRIRRPLPWVSVDPLTLRERCEELLGSSIKEHSREVRAWAESRDWTKCAKTFQRLVQGET